jgi:hypothetical protein
MKFAAALSERDLWRGVAPEIRIESLELSMYKAANDIFYVAKRGSSSICYNVNIGNVRHEGIVEETFGG